jgi:glycosyltransferase involved in cell wall biosynthesis
LFVGEASYLSSGFGLIGRELLTRLHKSNHVEVAEFSGYAQIDDIRSSQTPWKLYCNAVDKSDPRHAQYQSRPENQFGSWRFERVLLDFKPDIVFSFRDWWMDAFIPVSPLRQYFHQVLMPCCDSVPQQDEWIETFLQCDGVYTYTNWAFEQLQREGGGKIKLISSLSPCADLNLNKPPLNKRQHKENHGISASHFLVGTVMRNQKRKLFPDLFKTFAQYLDECNQTGQHELARRSFLYCHTSYPDLGWNIPALLKESGVASKVYFTYVCNNCKQWFPAIFQDARTTCHICKKSSAVLPNVGLGLNPNQMADVFKLFDLYCQYSIAEGFGCPITEAAACGVPVVVHDVTGMKDFASTLDAYTVQSRASFKEMETQAIRYYPDDTQLVNILLKHFKESESYRENKSRTARQLAETNYNWDDRASVLEDYFLNCTLQGLQGKWDTPYTPINTNYTLPDNLSNSQLVEWVLTNVLNEPEKVSLYTARSWLRGLNYDAMFTTGHQIDSFNREQLLRLVKIKLENKISCENVRCGIVGLEPQDFIDFANRK